MDRITNINIIKEFTNEGVAYGIYSLLFRGKLMVFIRNGNSIGTVEFLQDHPASECVSEITTGVKEEFLALLQQMTCPEKKI